MFDAVIKVGGSLCNAPAIQALAPRWAALARSYRLLFVAGGGLFADQVRAVDNRFHLSPSASHWMAIAAMDQNGYLLADCMPDVPAVHDLDSVVVGGNSSVLIPSTILREKDPLPHSWQITSDSLSAWLAGEVVASLLVLLKNVPGVLDSEQPERLIAEVPGEKLDCYGVVDRGFAGLLPAGTACWIVDGRRPDRLQRLLASGTTVGTRVVPVGGKPAEEVRR